MAFHDRRQSKDRLLRERMLERVSDLRLWMDPYSAGQFDALPDQASVDADFLEKARQGDACFVETRDPAECLKRCSRVLLYRWNRTYPADIYFPISILESRWSCVAKTDFAGSSHERITEELYEIK